MLAKSSKHVKLWPKLVSNRCKPVLSFLLAGNRDERLLPRVVNSSPKPFARSLRQLCRTAKSCNHVYNKFSICGTVCTRPVIVFTAVLLCMIEALWHSVALYHCIYNILLRPDDIKLHIQYIITLLKTTGFTPTL